MTLVMGILNTTPDSFSDGGKYDDVGPALEHARQLIAQGADIIDIGGESTRPGADPVEPSEEQRRVLPVVQALLAEDLPAQLSLDTRHPETARAVLESAGDKASDLIINDVSGLLTHPGMPQAVAEFGCAVVITHNRGDAKTMQDHTDYRDLLDEVSTELIQIRQRYLDAGVVGERIILDPGIGFAKTHAQNWELVRNLAAFTRLGNRVLFGVSRKGFLGTLLTEADGSPRPAEQRDTATATLSLLAAQAGCWAVRVHAPRPTADALAVAAAVAQTSSAIPGYSPRRDPRTDRP